LLAEQNIFGSLEPVRPVDRIHGAVDDPRSKETRRGKKLFCKSSECPAQSAEERKNEREKLKPSSAREVEEAMKLPADF
jgi:hypothetical protein